jgi:NTE family protein
MKVKDIGAKLIGLVTGERRVGLVLGGGAARGLAHVGVLKVLVGNNIPIHLIAGTSSGALLGALYAGGLDVNAIENAARRAGWNRLVRIAITRRGAVSGESMEKLIEEAIGYREFATLRIPFAAVATDLRTGGRIILNEGSVSKAVHASSAIPGVFVPVRVGDRLLSDGMITDNVPVDVALQMGANFVIAVDVIPNVVLEHEPANMVEVIERGLDIGVRLASKEAKSKADVLIEPVIKNFSPFSLNHAEELIRMGEEAAEKVLDSIRSKLNI